MPLNIESKTSYYQFDTAGMLIVPGDERSWRDSIGRTVLAWIAYGRPLVLARSLERCYSEGNLWRHPKHTERSSRDHWSYFIIYRYLKSNIEHRFHQFPFFIDNIPSMRGLNLWMKSLTGNKRAEKRYYFWAIPGAYIGNAWLRVCRWIGNIEPERDNNWWINRYSSDTHVDSNTNGWYVQHNRTTWQNIWGKIILNTIPAFALHIKAWQIYVMPKSEKKKKLQKILLRRVAKRNVLVRLVLGEGKRTLYDHPSYPNMGVYKSELGVTQEEVDNYPHLTGYRPGVYLDETCRRDIREMTEQESEFNSYEYDLIQWLYESNTRI